MSLPPLTILRATPDDVPTLISILFDAFANDKIIVGTCYPDTPANRTFWVRSTRSQMRHRGALVFKVIQRTVEGNEKIVGWAKWLLSGTSSSTGKEEQGAVEGEERSEGERQGAMNPEVEPSEDMNMDACRRLADGQYSMFEEVIGGRRCYWLNALAVHPSHQRRGAATMLVNAGTTLADQDGFECFSACTTQANENMKDIFERAGFDVVAERPVVDDLGVLAGHRKAKA